MAKLLAFSDVHLRDTGSFPAYNRIDLKSGLTFELVNIMNGLDWVCEQIQVHKPDLVAMLGDWHHHPDSVSTSVLYAGGIMMSRLRIASDAVGAKLVGFAGNHDMQSVHHRIHSLTPYQGMMELMGDQRVDFGDSSLAFLNFSNDYEYVSDYLSKAAKDESVEAIVTHLDFHNSVYETGRRSRSKISPEVGKLVISGDIHLPQKIGDVEYIGSLVQNRFNRTDMSGVGGILLYDSETKEVSRHPNTSSFHYVKIEDPSQLEGLPENVVLQVKCGLLSEMLPLIGDREFIHISQRVTDSKNEGEDNSPDMMVDTPEDTLVEYVQRVNPKAMNIVHEVIQESNKGEEK